MVGFLLGILNSNAFATFVLSMGAWFVKKKHDKAVEDRESTYSKRMEYVHSLKPYIVEAIKFAEHKIPDDTPNKALAKADLAFKVASNLLTHDGKETIPELIKSSITRIHKEMDLEGKLVDYMFNESDEDNN